MKTCAAKTKGSGQPCKLAALSSGRCRFHGGMSLKGIASPAFKHGLRSKYMPANLGARFRAAAADPELLRLDGDVALLEARLLELLERVGVGGSSGEAWGRLRGLWDEFRSLKPDEVDRARLVMGSIGEAIASGTSDAATWAAIRELVEDRRRVIDSIRKHEVQAQEALTLDQAMLLFAALSQAVKQNVQDRVALRRISEQFAHLMGRPGAPRLVEHVFDEAGKQGQK